MVAPERQRQGLGDVLFRTWDRNVGASLGLGLSESSYRLFQKMHWPDVGPVPCLVKPLSRRALRRPTWPVGRQPLRLVRHAAVGPARRAHAAAAGRGPDDPPLRRELHAALGARQRDRFAFAVRRDARVPQLEVHPGAARPLLDRRARARRRGRRLRRLSPRRRSRAAASRCSSISWPIRTTRRASSRCCAGSIARRARPTPTRSARSRCTTASASCCASRATTPSSRRWSSSRRSTPSPSPAGFYKTTDDWHVTLGDSDQDR